MFNPNSDMSIVGNALGKTTRMVVDGLRTLDARQVMASTAVGILASIALSGASPAVASTAKNSIQTLSAATETTASTPKATPALTGSKLATGPVRGFGGGFSKPSAPGVN